MRDQVAKWKGGGGVGLNFTNEYLIFAKNILLLNSLAL